jgi:plasmid stability protein
MCGTCLYAGDMSKMTQVRNVPEHVHGTLKARAARETDSTLNTSDEKLQKGNRARVVLFTH